MAALYQLEIVTPMGRKFEGLVDNCVFRSTEGDVGILKGTFSLCSCHRDR